MQKRLLCGLLAIVLLTPPAWALFKRNVAAANMTLAAAALLESLDKEQLAAAQLPYDSPKRIGWHFIPKKERKGLQIKHMTEKQRKAGHALLQAALSKIGYNKTVKIMQLEALLNELEGGNRGDWRDPEKYYFTVFGQPKDGQRWGLSYEGHHLSLNFVVEGDRVVSSTPQFFATNPGVIKNANKTGIKKGVRILDKEELLAFELVRSLDEGQRVKAIIADKAPREIRNAGEAQPPNEPASGIAASQLEAGQLKTLRALIETYASSMPYEVAEQRLSAIEKAGVKKIHFAWAGPLKEGIGHYYRMQGPTFLIELVNTQPDAAGNPANHVHCVWRDMRGDFALPIAKK